MENEFVFTKVWISESEFKIRRTGGGKPPRYLDAGNKQIPNKLDGEEPYIEPIIDENEIITN